MLAAASRSLRELEAALEAGEVREAGGGPQWRHRGLYLFPGHNVIQPLRPGPPLWRLERSRSNQAEYWFNPKTNERKWRHEADAEAEAGARPISFRSCAANMVRWDRAAAMMDGGMSEAQLREMAQQVVDVAAQRRAREEAAKEAEPKPAAPPPAPLFAGISF
jgi:hypothetical protein